MRNAVRLALLCMAATAGPVYAQTALPQCVSSNLDQSRQLFTVMNPASGVVNQQCLLTVYESGSVPQSLRQNPAGYFVAGTYAIDISGGGGGGGGGAVRDGGGGGGGAGAAPSRTTQFLPSGTYKLTLGTGGSGGSASGGRTESGNPTSLTNISTGQVIAGFPGADTWTQQSSAARDGRGGVGAIGGSTGGDGGGSRAESAAQTGSASATPGYFGVAGQAGGESGRSAPNAAGTQVVQANAGGGGGSGAGSGGAGDSATINSAAGTGDLGGGGGGGRGGVASADAGAEGGHGFIRLALIEVAPQPLALAPVAAPAPRVVAAAPVSRRITLSTDALFGFGRSTLQPSGEAKLDDLVNNLRDVNIERISDVGHADRIGSSAVNQKISESRAESVKAYLVSKGIQSDRIMASGMGESQPVTGSNACAGPKRADIITCLQPDRRVDIEVIGTSK